MTRFARPKDFKTLGDLIKLEGLECAEPVSEEDEFEMLYESGMRIEDFAIKEDGQRYAAFLKEKGYDEPQ